MLDSYVALDLETTGFDPLSDRVIEVGAVRFTGGRASERLATFVRPGREVPPEVTALTGIGDADLLGAPAMHEVLPGLLRFIGDDPVVGHNAGFDVAFLAANGAPPPSAIFDTYDLAAALEPRVARLDLRSLAQHLAVPQERWHRALDDAETAGAVFATLLARLEAMPRSLRADLAAFARRAHWSLATLFEPPASLPASLSPSLPAGALEEGASGLAGTLGAEPRPLPAPLEPRQRGGRVVPADLEALFARAEGALPGFERRESQETVARAIAAVQGHGGHLAVEAGTGTGKSLAYLLPSALLAARSGRRVVVSTHTLNLQEQLLERDLPAALALVEGHEGLPAGALRGAVLKGRANYLCRERWAEACESDAELDLPSARLLCRIAVWLRETEHGERGELYLAGDERDAWARLSAADTDCLSRRCPFVRDGSCFLLRARAHAAAAHVLVVNHALLLAGAEHQVLPPFEHLVLDEAHRIEDVATQQFGRSIAIGELAALADEAINPAAGGVAAALRHAGVEGQPLSPAAGLAAAAQSIAEAGQRLRERTPDLDRALRGYLEEFGDGPEGDRRATLTLARRAQPAWEDVEEAAMHVDLVLLHLGQQLEQARLTVEALPEGVLPGLDRTLTALRRTSDRASAARDALRDGALRAHGEDITWVEEGARGGPRLRLAPLSVHERLASDVYAGARSVIATSATLQAHDGFGYATRTLGLEEPDTLAVPSPFDYRRAVLTLVVDDIAEPGEPGYEPALHEALLDAAEAAHGRTLALFTSHGAVRAAAGALRGPLRAAGIGVLAQGLDGAPARLLRALAEQDAAVVLGTAALWEGVDVRGDALSQLAIARLPFPVPTDPVYAGRAALYDDPFEQFALPQAVLRFRQGFGRLIRGPRERGVFLVFDRRVLTRAYGQAFLDALPDCEVRRVRAADLARHVRAWLQR